MTPPDVRSEISGHTDSTEADTINKSLSYAHASKVANFFRRLARLHRYVSVHVVMEKVSLSLRIKPLQVVLETVRWKLKSLISNGVLNGVIHYLVF